MRNLRPAIRTFLPLDYVPLNVRARRTFSFLSQLLLCAGWLAGCAATVVADDDVQAICRQWARAAAAIETARIRLSGTEVHSAVSPPDKQGQPQVSTDVELPVEIDYLFARDGREKFRRSGKMPNPKGIAAYDYTEAQRGAAVRSLFAGSNDPEGLFQYDDYQIFERPAGRGVSDFTLFALQILLQHPTLPVAYRFEEGAFHSLPDARIELGGQACRGMERITHEEHAERTVVWYEEAPPHRIRRVTRESNRRDNYEYEFEYSKGSGNADPEEVAWPLSVVATMRDPSGNVMAIGRCAVQSVETNPPLDNSQFDLPIPVGALVSDLTKTPPAYAIRLADGTLRSLTRAEQNPESVLRLSAAVVGSRAEGQTPRAPVASTRSWYVLLIVLNAVVVAACIAWFVSRGRRLKSQPGE